MREVALGATVEPVMSAPSEWNQASCRGVVFSVKRSLVLVAVVAGCGPNIVTAPAPTHVDGMRERREAPARSRTADGQPPPISERARIDGEPIELEPPRHDSVTTYCAKRVAAEDQAQRTSGLWAHLQPTGAACREVELPLAFRPTAPFGVVHAIETKSPLHDDRTTLFVETPDGLAATGIEWDWENPTVGQSPQNPATLEELRVEDGRLLAIVGRRQGWMAADGTAELALLRAAVACEMRGRALSCLRFFPDETRSEAPLGMKRTSFSNPKPWSDLTWDRSPRVRVERDQLVVMDR